MTNIIKGLKVEANSSWVKSYLYDGNNDCLYVWTKDDIYRYCNVTPALYTELRTASSVGKWMKKLIGDTLNFPFDKALSTGHKDIYEFDNQEVSFVFDSPVIIDRSMPWASGILAIA